jgi:hypothetical protein
VATLGLAGATGIVGAMLLASPAQAHTSEVTGVGRCVNGNWSVTWTVKNNFRSEETVSNVRFSTAGTGTLPATVDANTSKSSTATFPGTATTISVKFDASWAVDGFEENDIPGTATLTGDCPAAPSPSPSVSTSKAPPPALVVTGPPTGAMVAGGGFLVVLGAALIVMLRRRRRVTFVAD